MLEKIKQSRINLYRQRFERKADRAFLLFLFICGLALAKGCGLL